MAVSNSVIGVILLLTGLLGALAQAYSPAVLILVLAAMALVAAVLCQRPPEV